MTVMSPAYRQIIALFAERRGAAMRARRCAHAIWVLGTEARQWRGCGEAEAPGGAAVILAEAAPGLFKVDGRKRGPVSAAGTAGGELAGAEDAFAASAGLFERVTAELAGPGHGGDDAFAVGGPAGLRGCAR